MGAANSPSSLPGLPELGSSLAELLSSADLPCLQWENVLGTQLLKFLHSNIRASAPRVGARVPAHGKVCKGRSQHGTAAWEGGKEFVTEAGGSSRDVGG